MADEIHDDNSFNSDSIKPIAHITGRDIDYEMVSDKVIIGRNSAAGFVDIDMGKTTFVSRRHLEICFQNEKLKLKCLGKNGIFINDTFRTHSASPYDLPPKCVLRFPSTNMRLHVDMYLDSMNGSSSTSHLASTTPVGAASYTPKKKAALLAPSLAAAGSYQGRKGQGSNLVYLSGHLSGSASGRLVTLPSGSRGLSSSVGPSGHGPDEMTGRRQLSQSFSQLNHHRLDDATVDDLEDSYLGSSAGGAMLSTAEEDLGVERGSDTEKPPYSYAQLIVQSIISNKDHQLTLSAIYAYISKNYPFYKVHDKGWQNSIRHNLSLNRYFVKVPRSQEEPGKGSFWRIDPLYEAKLVSQAFHKRRQRGMSMMGGYRHAGQTTPHGQQPYTLVIGNSGKLSRDSLLSDPLFSGVLRDGGASPPPPVLEASAFQLQLTGPPSPPWHGREEETGSPPAPLHDVAMRGSQIRSLGNTNTAAGGSLLNVGGRLLTTSGSSLTTSQSSSTLVSSSSALPVFMTPDGTRCIVVQQANLGQQRIVIPAQTSSTGGAHQIFIHSNKQTGQTSIAGTSRTPTGTFTLKRSSSESTADSILPSKEPCINGVHTTTSVAPGNGVKDETDDS